MFGLNWLRNTLTFEIGDKLTSFTRKGSLVLLKRTHDDITFVPAETERTKYLWGFIPIFEISEEGRMLSIRDDITGPIYNLAKQIRVLVVGSSQTIWRVAIKNILKHFREGLDLIRQQALLDAKQGYEKIHSNFLEDIMKRNQNSYRQKVSDVLQTSGREVLTKTLQKHLAMFLVKVQSEGQKLSARGFFSSGIMALPSNCKFVFRRGAATVFFIEQPPQVRTIYYLGGQFQIALPYVIFVVTFKGDSFVCLQTFFRTSPFQNEADELLCTALPNIRGDYSICFPAPENGKDGLGKFAEEAIQNFWGSNFNRDLDQLFLLAASRFTELRSFEEWQSNSKANPRFVLNIPWIPTNLSVNTLADSLINKALVLDDEPGRGGIQELQEYASDIGERFSREIAEKIHFMVSHSMIEVDNLSQANDQLTTLVQSTMEGVKDQLDKLFSTPVEKKKIDQMCQNVQQELITPIESLCSQCCGSITAKTNQL